MPCERGGLHSRAIELHSPGRRRKVRLRRPDYPVRYPLFVFRPLPEVPLKHDGSTPMRCLCIALCRHTDAYQPMTAHQYTSGCAKIRSSLRRVPLWNDDDGGSMNTVKAFSSESQCVVRSGLWPWNPERCMTWVTIPAEHFSLASYGPLRSSHLANAGV